MSTSRITSDRPCARWTGCGLYGQGFVLTPAMSMGSTDVDTKIIN